MYEKEVVTYVTNISYKHIIYKSIGYVFDVLFTFFK